MSDPSVQEVLGYLRRHGYSLAEEALLKESKVKSLDILGTGTWGESLVPKAALLDEDGQDLSISLKSFDESYTSLRKWVDSSIDAYKVPLVLADLGV